MSSCINPEGHQYTPIETQTVETQDGSFAYVNELMCVHCMDITKVTRTMMKKQIVQNTPEEKV